MSWSELEGKLSDRRRPGGTRHADGGDAPGWSRKRLPYAPPSPSRPPDHEVTPYAELHCHSNFSFLDGASQPEELVEEAVRLGIHALAMTDHDGLYGVVRMAEAAETYGLPTVIGAELSLGSDRTAERRRRSRGRAPRRARRATGGLPPAGQDHHRCPAARRRERQAQLRPRRGRGRRRRSVHDPDRLPEEPRSAGVDHRRRRQPLEASSTDSRRCSARTECWSSCSTMGIRSTASTTTPSRAWHVTSGSRPLPPTTCTSLRRATQARRDTFGDPSQAQSRRHGRLAPCLAARPPPYGGGDGRTVHPLSRRGRPHRRDRPSARVPPPRRQAAAAAPGRP